MSGLVRPPLPGGEGWGEGGGARSNFGFNAHSLSPNPSPPGGGEQNRFEVHGHALPPNPSPPGGGEQNLHRASTLLC